MSNDMAYLVLLKRKTELENELEAIKIAMSCFTVEQPQCEKKATKGENK